MPPLTSNASVGIPANAKAIPSIAKLEVRAYSMRAPSLPYWSICGEYLLNPVVHRPSLRAIWLFVTLFSTPVVERSTL